MNENSTYCFVSENVSQPLPLYLFIVLLDWRPYRGNRREEGDDMQQRSLAARLEPGCCVSVQ